MFEAVNRLHSWLPIYPAPSAEYVPMTHTPFFPLLAAAITSVVGLSAGSLRFVAVIAAVGAWVLIFLAVRRETKSSWFGLIAAGLYAAAYRSFDGYLDWAYCDSWLLFMSLLGIYIIQEKKSIIWNTIGVAILCFAFWFKQHGAFIAIGGVAYLTWQNGIRGSLLYWGVAAVLGPVAYIVLGPQAFGSNFLYYTYKVPSAWSEFNQATITRLIRYFGRRWLLLTLVCLFALVAIIRRSTRVNAWLFTLPFAALVGFLGTLDPGSENNQYILPGVWIIIVGSISLAQYLAVPEATDTFLRTLQQRAFTTALIYALSFALLAYNPAEVFIPARAWQDYDALVTYIEELDGVTFMAGEGQLPGSYRLPFVVPYVQLEDLIRGPGHDYKDTELIKSILQPLEQPTKNTYIIMSSGPLEEDPLLGYLSTNYTLIDDLGDRFISLRAVPGRFPRGWPRYIYAYNLNQPPPPLKSK
jgi:hypothetical protein